LRVYTLALSDLLEYISSTTVNQANNREDHFGLEKIQTKFEIAYGTAACRECAS